MIKTIKTQKKAFLLFEAMIAIIVLAVGIAVALRSFNSAIMAVKGLQDYTTAAFLLQEKMFQLETEGPDKTGIEGDFPDRQNFSWKIDSAALDDVALDKIEMSVMWNNKDITRSFSVNTYLERKQQEENKEI